MEGERDCRGLGVSSISSESSRGIKGIVRKSKEFWLGMLLGPWIESRIECLLDFGVATCGTYCKRPLCKVMNEICGVYASRERGTDLKLSSRHAR